MKLRNISCPNNTKSYLFHLFKQKEILGYTLATYHNLFVMERFFEKIRERISKDLASITGQRPVTKKAKKSIASFKIREGLPIGLALTLRGKRMFDFMDRFVNIALPRSRDFRGIEAKNLDGQGNLNIGIRESSIFPELNYENMKDVFSLEVTFVTTAKNKEQGMALFKKMGFPIK